MALASGSTNQHRSPNPRRLVDFDAIIFGTPTCYGGLASQVGDFLDRTGGLPYGAATIAGTRGERPVRVAVRQHDRITLSSAQLAALLDGCEWRAPAPRRRPELAG